MTIKTLTADSGAFSAGDRVTCDSAEATEGVQYVDELRLATWEELGILGASGAKKRRSKKAETETEPETDTDTEEEVGDGESLDSD